MDENLTFTKSTTLCKLLMLKAHITFVDDFLRAELSDGRVLSSDDSLKFAAMLVEAGVHVDDAYCADWREGDISPGAGAAIAIKFEMRRLLGLLT